MKKGKRVARFTIKVEAIGLGEALEIVVFLREIWKDWSDKGMGIMGKTDSKALESNRNNRILKIDIAAIKE